MPNICQANIGNKYPMIIPRNWVKFGLKIDEVQAKVHQIWVKIIHRNRISFFSN
jgi:hypothetical protein